MRSLEITLLSQRIWLHPLGAAYWEEGHALLLADLHLGKVSHFRRHGIAVPMQVAEAELQRLQEVIDFFSPRRVVLLGDLFHSNYNAEWEAFRQMRTAYSELHFELVTGNHDILPEKHYREAGLISMSEQTAPPFFFTHHPTPADRGYNIAGHLHPAVRLHGSGKQRLYLPCFLFGKEAAVLPAFGRFTGTHLLQPEETDRVFVLSGEEVLEV